MDLSADRVELLRRVYPAVDIRPLDLFKYDRNKRIWDLKVNHLGRNYDVVGVFNFDEAKSAATYVSWKDLGLADSQRVHVFDFWNKEYLGAWEKGISLDLGPASSRVLTLLTEADHPQLISTSRHIPQGWVDLVAQTYNRGTNTYAGKSKVIKSDPYELRFVYTRGQNFMIKNAAAMRGTSEASVSIAALEDLRRLLLDAHALDTCSPSRNTVAHAQTTSPSDRPIQPAAPASPCSGVEQSSRSVSRGRRRPTRRPAETARADGRYKGGER